MYIATGSGRSKVSAGLDVQAQQTQAAGSGMAAAIRAADASLTGKKNEARRIYENNQTMMRNDLDQIAKFDVSQLGGPGIAKGMKEYADKLSAQIREVNDPVEAKKLIGDFTNKYNYLKEAKSKNEEFRGDYLGAYNASEAELNSMNSGLPAGQKVKVPTLQDIMQRDRSYDRDVVVTDDFQLMVDDGQGGLMPIEGDEGLIDPKAWEIQQEEYDLGDIDTHAKDEGVISRIDFRLGRWNEKDAREVYVDDILSENPNGQTGGNAVRNMVLNSLENRNLIPYMDDEMKRQFEAGEFDRGRVFGVDYDEDGRKIYSVDQSELTKDEKMFRDALEKGEDLFVEETKHISAVSKDKSANSGGRTKNSKIVKNGTSVMGYLDDNVIQEMGGPNADYNINAFKKPLVKYGSISPGVNSVDGNFEITGAGYAPDGRLMATVRQQVLIPGEGFDDTPTKDYEKKVIYLTEIGEEAPIPGMEREIFEFITQDPDMGPVLQQDRRNTNISIVTQIGQQGESAVGTVDMQEIFNKKEEVSDQDVAKRFNDLEDEILTFALGEMGGGFGSGRLTESQIRNKSPEQIIEMLMPMAGKTEKKRLQDIKDQFEILKQSEVGSIYLDQMDKTKNKAAEAARQSSIKKGGAYPSLKDRRLSRAETGILGQLLSEE